MIVMKQGWKFRTLSLTAGVYFILLIGLFFLAVNTVSAQEPFVYPQKGQSQDQMEKDKYQCYDWAKGQTGFDPMAVPTATAPPPQAGAPQGGVGKGAVRGGVAGLAVGAIAGDAGKGAAIGATAGALFGGMRRQDQKQQQEQAEQQWAQEQAAQYNQKRSAYDRAYSACLEGRGYTVK